MRINPANGTEHICGWISSCKIELLTSVDSLNMKKWMVSDGKLCSHSVKRKIQNTNTEWRNNICKVSYSVSIHISPCCWRWTPFWWRTQTLIKKWKQKKYFLEKSFLFFILSFVQSITTSTRAGWVPERSRNILLCDDWSCMRKTASLIEKEKNQEIFIIVVAVKEIDSIDHKETTSQMYCILKEVLFIANNDKICSQNKNKQQLKDFLTEKWGQVEFIQWFLFAMVYCWYSFVKRN